MELNVQDWKEYKVDKLFTVVLSKGDIKADEMDCGTIRLVSSGETDNGIVAHIDSFGDGKAEIFDGNIITADMFCNAYYQNECFYAVSHGRVNILLPNFELNSHIGLFISTIINNEKYKYSYGRALYSNVVSSMVIKLPTQLDKDNNTYIIDENRTYSDEGYIPDWQFMEDYIKSLHHKPITTKVKAGNVKDLDVDNWEEFKVSGLFTLLNGKGITKEEIEENSGTFVAVQSGEENNGVLGKIDKQYCIKMGYTLTDKMCLTVARTGSAGFVSFQSTGCVVGDSAKILLLNDDIATTNIYLFLQTVLTANRFKYDYGRKVTEDKYLADIIKLPIKRDNIGNPVIDDNRTYSDNGYIPDWQFMEDYINSLPYSDRI